MKPEISQIAVGVPKNVDHQGKPVTTGIFKSAVTAKVDVGLTHLAGDGQADLTVHGGRDKAIYVYPEVHYAYWRQELGVESLQVSQFGENLTVTELSEESVIIGDRYQLGSTTVQVTQPRIPCFKLGIRIGDNNFPARFLASGRLGFYLRVEATGQIQLGDEFILLERGEQGISIHQLWKATFEPEKDFEIIERALASLPHLDAGWQRRLQQILKNNGLAAPPK